jgi:hypothetical protein
LWSKKKKRVDFLFLLTFYELIDVAFITSVVSNPSICECPEGLNNSILAMITP